MEVTSDMNSSRRLRGMRPVGGQRAILDAHVCDVHAMDKRHVHMGLKRRRYTNGHRQCARGSGRMDSVRPNRR